MRRKLNTSKLSNENLLITIRSILDKYGQRLSYPICKYDKNKKIETTILEKCKSVFKDKTTNGSSQPNRIQCPGIGILYEEKWILKEDDKITEILKTFIPSDSSLRNINSQYYVDIQDVSVAMLRKYVNSLPQKYKMTKVSQVKIHKRDLT